MGTVLRGDFTANQRAQSALAALDKWPDCPDVPGQVFLHCNGETLELLLSDDQGGWRKILSLDALTLMQDIGMRRAERKRILLRIDRLRCDHEFKRRKCVRCGAELPKKWTRCRLGQPATHLDWKRGRACRVVHSGHVTYTMHDARCRRRAGHEGPCSWDES